MRPCEPSKGRDGDPPSSRRRALRQGSRSPVRPSPTARRPAVSATGEHRCRRTRRSPPAARRPGRAFPGAGGPDGGGPRSRPRRRSPRATAAASSPSGLKRGVGYRLRIANIPERPGVEVFPVIEVVGHLHRPEGIDPGKYPIRVIFTLDDIDAVLNQGRLVTKVIYLEDPDQALPFHLPKDQIPVVSLNPTEHPLRVAAALGRPMAIVRIGGRRPTIEEVQGGPGDLGLDYAAAPGLVALPLPDAGRLALPDGGRTALHGGRSAGRSRSFRATSSSATAATGASRSCVGPDGRLGGIEPRDAAVRFDIGLGPSVQPRTLPTNVVCIYAPRFAEVRVATGEQCGDRDPAPQHQRPNSDVHDGQHQGRIPTPGAEPVRRAGPHPLEGLGIQGAGVHRRGVEQPRRRRLREHRPGLLERPEADRRAGPQSPEGGHGEGEGPSPGDQDGRVAGRHRDHRGRQRGGAWSGGRTR